MLYIKSIIIITDIILTINVINGKIIDTICLQEKYMFFESFRSTSKNYFRFLVHPNNKGYPLHFHKAYECYSVTSGEAKVTVGENEYVLHSGDAVLIFPYQCHSSVTKENTATRVYIFSPDIVESFHDSRRVPKSNVFKLPTTLPDKCDSLLYRKSLCYNICAVFDENAEYTDSPQTDDSLILKILFFISENYHGECSLTAISNFVGYDYSYVSKFFKKSTGMSVGAYVNGLRISDARRMLSHTEKTIREIAEECGFASQRTFNRDFLKSVGKTPMEYRKEL